PREAEVAWARFADEDRLDETLSLLATTAEGDAFSEGGIGWRQWLRVAKGDRRLTDLQLLLEVFARTGLPIETRDWLFESVALPILWRLRGAGASRTLARLTPRRVFFHAEGLDRRAGNLVEALRRPAPRLTRARRALAEAMIEAARVAMATRQPAAPGVRPHLRHADRRGRSLPARPPEHRGPPVRLVLLLSSARVPPARSDRHPRAGRGAGENRRGPRVPLARPRAQATGGERGIPDAPGRARRTGG